MATPVTELEQLVPDPTITFQSQDWRSDPSASVLRFLIYSDPMIKADHLHACDNSHTGFAIVTKQKCDTKLALELIFLLTLK